MRLVIMQCLLSWHCMYAVNLELTDFEKVLSSKAFDFFKDSSLYHDIFLRPLTKITSGNKPQNVVECFRSEIYITLFCEILFGITEQDFVFSKTQKELFINEMLRIACEGIDDVSIYVDMYKNVICSMIDDAENIVLKSILQAHK